MRQLILLPLLFAIGLHAQEAAKVARLVNEAAVDTAALGKALQSSDALVRATAARVSLVRNAAALLPALRTQLAAESNADAARELIRAIAILGGDDDVAFAASQLKRFPGAIDTAFVDALARTPDAIDRYLRYREQLRGGLLPATLPYWRGGNPHAAASRLLGARDVASFSALVRALTDSGQTLDAGVAAAALASDDERIRRAVVWHLAQRAVAEPGTVPAPLREPAGSMPGATVEERFGRELLRRAGGAAPVADKAFAEWLKGRGVHLSLEPLLTKQERVIAYPRGVVRPGVTSSEVATPAFHLPLVLPPRLGPAILSSSRCTAGWLGVAAVSTDHAGRVTEIDTGKVAADRGCIDALTTIARLSLAAPARFGAGTASSMLVSRTEGQPPCFDESSSLLPLRAGGDGMTAPKVKTRVNPHYPDSVRRSASGSFTVVAEATISSQGCIRDIRLIQQTPYADLNRAAIESLAKWSFTPGTLNGVPVDVLFNLTINFRH